MEHICTRCTRLGLRPKYTGPSSTIVNRVRLFSTSRVTYDEGDRKPSSSFQQGRPLAGASLSSAIDPKATSSPAVRARQSPSGDVPIRRTSGPLRTRNTTGAAAGVQARAGGSLGGGRPGAGAGTGARTGSAAGSHIPGPPRFLQRTGAPRPDQRQVLTRKPGQGQYQGQQAQRPGQRFTPRGQQAQAQTQPGNFPPKTDRRVRRLNERTATQTASEEDSLEAADLPTRIDNYVNAIVDPPANPTTELPHTPGTHLTAHELRKDWPNTPLSHAGLVESVQQRIEWLAHRLPHGYQTPNQLATHYTQGNLTRFESQAERDEVLSISRTLAQKWADRDTEKAESGGVAVQPEDMEFDSIVDRVAEKQGLADTWVRGTYPEVQKQPRPYMDQIVRNLNNNSTMTDAKSAMFMQTVQSVVTRQALQGAAQVQKRAEAASK